MASPSLRGYNTNAKAVWTPGEPTAWQCHRHASIRQKQDPVLLLFELPLLQAT
jgi:hypothetical protein